MNLPKILHLAYRSRMKTRNWHRIVRAMAMVVVFCTTYALILPAITMESDTVCGITAHSHTEQCYETVTALHTHDDFCYTRTVVCGMEEHPAHTHLAECTGFLPTLICENTGEDHYHNAACYSYEQGLVCGLTESEGHTHSDACYQLELTCGLSEAQEVSVTNLICGYDEHVHEEGCYPAPTETTAEETFPAAGDPNADVEMESDWLESFASIALPEVWSEKLHAVAESQLGYAESKRNLSYDEAGNVFGYTRYGAWYGQPYGRWDAMFVSFCLHYAGVEGIPYGSDTAQWLEALTEEGLYLPKSEYTPASGDLVFLDRDYDEEADHVGIVSALDAHTGIVTLIAGDWDHRVDWVEVDGTAILGYVPLPEEPAEEPESYFGQSEEGIAAEVLLHASLPEGAELSVTPLAEENEAYAAMAAQVSGAVAESIEKLTLLDLSFYASGEYLPVSDSATVTLYFEGDIFQNRQVKVFHLTENGPTELNSTATTFSTFSLREESTQTMLTFETEGFSVFAVVEVVGAYEQVDLTDLAQLDGNSFYIISNSKNKGMLASLNTLGYGLAKTDVTVPTDIGTSSLWTFDKQEDGTYLIHSGDSYLIMQAAENGLAHLKITDQASATYFTVGICDDDAGIGQVVISYTDGGATYYLNQYQGDNGPGFYGWHDPPYNGGDAGSKNYLYRNTAASDTTIPATDLGGKSFAIVNPHTNKAMTTIADVEVGTTYSALHSAPVTIIQIDGVNYYTSTENVPLWTFAAVPDSPGVYTISATVGTETLYLNMTTEQRGHLTLSSTPQNLTVTALANGKVLIGNGSTYLNSSGSDTTNDFWCYNGTENNSQQLLCLPAPVDSSFTITYDNTYTITFNLVDSVGNPLYATRTDHTLASTDKDIIKFADIAPPIEGYTYNSAHYTKDNNTYPLAGIGANESSFRLYRPEHFEGTSGQYYTEGRNVTVTLVYQNRLLNYDLHRPSGSWFANTAGWDVSNPSITSTSQDIAEDTDGQTLHTVDGRNLVGKFVLNTLTERYNEVNYYNDCNQDQYTAGTLTADNYLVPGAEYIFLGWQATINGTTHLFPEGAAITLDDNGDFRIADTDGNMQTVPVGTTLVGQWKQVSNAVMFFVNHGDTMLEKEDNLPITRTDSDYYTGIIAIGHIYNLPEQDIDTGNIQKATHDLIEAQLKPYYDPSSSATQLVVDAINISTTSTSSYKSVDHYNETLLENSASSYIRNHTSGTILLDNAELDKSEITPDNYRLYWYVQKRVGTDGNAYHIDGVLVAKTQPMEIYKTFSGLTTAQADDAIAQMSFPLHLVSQLTLDGAEVDKKNAYTTLKAAASQSGVYTFDGRQSAGNIFKWTLESVQGQRYTFEEDGYDVTGYDCSSLVSVHYADGAVVYKYNTDATYTDLSTGTANTITDLYAEKPLVGGQVESIIFANFYTEEGTGMFSISKVADAEGKIRLPGAEFTLTQGDTVITQTTNENGAAHFSNLEPGTYTLTETKAPTGYQSLDTTWTVVVAKDDTDRVTVTIGEKTVYDSENGGIQEDGVYLIQNTPQNTTVTVNKDFSDQLTDDEMRELEDYAIEVQDGNGTVVKTLTLQDATAITGSINAYTWTIDLNCGSTYQFVESGYSHMNYLDTVVSASVNGVAQTVTKSENNTTASFSMVKGQAADTVNITNDYTNTFDLRIHKVNATAETGEIPNMSGIKFNIYGDFQFHQKPSDDTAASISYTYNGAEGTAWYIGTTAETGTDGYTLFRNMHLTSGTDTFLYVIDEANTPAGFVKLDEPIVRVVRVNGGDPNYSNGVYTLTVENFKPDLATVTVTATKQWALPDGMDPTEVTLTLYQKDADNEIAKVQTVKLDGNTSSVTEADGITASINGWTVVWSGLSYADGETPNEYYVAETPMDGYNTSYSTHISTNSVGTQQIEMALAEGYNLKRSVTITNSSGYELPQTGGQGVWWNYLLGLGLIAAAVWLHRLGIQEKRQGGMDSS